MTDYLEDLPDLAELVQTFSKHEVDYLVVGGHAVGFHAVPRATKDLDLWINPDSDNRQRVAMALEEYGAPKEIIDNLLGAEESDIVWFGRPPNRIDFLFVLPGLRYSDAVKNVVCTESGGEKVPIIGIQDLMINKQTVARPQDLADLAALQEVQH